MPPSESPSPLRPGTSPFEVLHGGKRHKSSRGHVTHDVSLTVVPEEGRWIPIDVELAHPGRHPSRAHLLLVDQRRPAPPCLCDEEISHALGPAERARRTGARGSAGDPRRELGTRPGDSSSGNKALCSTCHQVRGEGTHIGPDLSTLPHRTYASVLRDIQDPSASINPDYPTWEFQLASGESVVAVPLTQPDGTVRLGIGPGSALTVKSADLVARKTTRQIAHARRARPNSSLPTSSAT